MNIAQRANHPTSTVLPIDGKIQALVGKDLNAYDKPTNSFVGS